MKLFSLVGCLSALLFCFASSGCDSGGGPAEVTTNQSELEKFMAENPDFVEEEPEEQADQ